MATIGNKIKPITRLNNSIFFRDSSIRKRINSKGIDIKDQLNIFLLKITKKILQSTSFLIKNEYIKKKLLILNNEDVIGVQINILVQMQVG